MSSPRHDLDLPVIAVRRDALGDQVADRLRRLIVTGKVPAGYRLVESSLSADFGVSRGPIRDALSTLQSEGLVASGGRGLAVVGLSADDLVELFSLRRTLETFALQRCAKFHDADWRPAVKLLDQLDRAATDEDAHTFAEADLEFHTSLYRIAKHRRLLRVWQAYRPIFAALLEVATAQDRDLRPSAQSHRKILDRLRSGDLDGAQAELSAHLDGAHSRLETFRAAHHDRHGDV